MARQELFEIQSSQGGQPGAAGPTTRDAMFSADAGKNPRINIEGLEPNLRQQLNTG